MTLRFRQVTGRNSQLTGTMTGVGLPESLITSGSQGKHEPEQPRKLTGAFDDYLKRLSDALASDGHAVTVFELREMDIKYCIGCFGCWVKTPGECIVPDESRDVRRAAIHSDLVLWASPVIMGFYSALLKKVTDKFLPLLHPYTVVDQGKRTIWPGMTSTRWWVCSWKRAPIPTTRTSR